MVDKKTVSEAISQLREGSAKRKFTQSFDMVVRLTGIDIKKTEQQLDFYVTLHYSKGKKGKICALVGPELATDAKNVFDTVIVQDDFKNYEDKKKLKKLADEHTFFVAQANIMPAVAKTFGKVLGTRGKMPNPKAGCVVPPKANLKPLYEKLQNTVRIKAKTALMVQSVVGSESMKDEELIDNIITLYNQIVQHLPNHENNISKIMLKLTMSKPVEIR